MAGETQLSTALTNARAGISNPARLAKGRVITAVDHHQFAAATELEAADNLIMKIEIPSNAIVMEIAIYNDDLDTHACETLVLDFGVAAAQDYKDVTSGTVSSHKRDAIIDADLFIDGATTGQAATTNWTVLTPDATTFGPEDAIKPVWELLGYDGDPRTIFNLVVQSQAAAAQLSAAGDLSVRVTYLVD